jgi:teichuronic acid biosynthesis glycosyltransferase TuaC
MRTKLNLPENTLLSVGNLVEEKGHHLVVESLQQLPHAHLVVIGSGSEQAALQRLAEQLGVATRIRWVAHVNQAELAEYYSAAALTVLASSREGMANVLLESLSCGTPVVAAHVGGNPEIVADPAAGVLLPERGAAAIATAVRALLINPIDRNATCNYAKQFSWHEPIAQQIELLQSVVAEARLRRAA